MQVILGTGGMKLFGKWRVRKAADDASHVYVSERHGVRSLHIGTDTIQSSMRLTRPNDLELAYTRSMMAFLLFIPRPQDVLMIGLGGGSLAKFLYHRLPETRTQVVEVNPQVVAIAQQCFQVPSDGPRFEVVVSNGAEHVRRKEISVDVIMVDGYEADTYVEELASSEFYRACCARLRAAGVLVVNLWSGDRLFGSLLQRIQNAFPGGSLCLPAERPGNVAVFGFKDNPGAFRWEELQSRARALEVEHSLEFSRFVEGLRKMNRHDTAHLYAR